MKISPADIPAIYAGFVDSELAPKAASSLQRFMAYGTVFVAQRKVDAFFSEPGRREQLKAMGVMGDDGLIDLDYLREMATYAMQQSGGKVTAWGIILDQSDIDKLYQLGAAVAHE